MPDPKDNTVMLEGVQIIFRNFTGAEKQFNKAGDRNFVVLLEDDVAEAMEKDGWNIKRLRPREDDEEQNFKAYLSVTVGYKGRPPRVVMVTSRGRTTLDESMVEMLDWADILFSDIIIRPYDWTVNGNSGRKAYLKSAFVTIDEDALELKYADIPEIEFNSGPRAIEGGGPLEIDNIIEGEIVGEDD